MNKWHQRQTILLLLWSVILTANCLRHHIITACDSISGAVLPSDIIHYFALDNCWFASSIKSFCHLQINNNTGFGWCFVTRGQSGEQPFCRLHSVWCRWYVININWIMVHYDSSFVALKPEMTVAWNEFRVFSIFNVWACNILLVMLYATMAFLKSWKMFSIIWFVLKVDEIW